jgi:hypothetical protein
MSTQAQINANRANAQQSTGPTSAVGKAASSQNNFRHGLTGPFSVLPWENQEEFKTLQQDLLTEHQPVTRTELILVQEMTQSYWLMQRAIRLQNGCFSEIDPLADSPKQLALYLRYQTTHNRAFYKALNELQRLREQKRKAEIGFVSQERKQAEQKAAAERGEAREKRQEAAENRAQEIHEARVWLMGAQARRHETETTLAKFFKMPKTEQKDSATAA